MAQPASPERIIVQRTDSIPGFYVPSLSEQYIFIASRFGSDEIEQNAKLDSISGFLIREIVLVYSGFRKAENFRQQELNANRWANLQKGYPGLFHTGSTTYRNVCQTGTHSDSSARKLTHGFYIYFENRVDEKLRLEEITELSKMISALGIDTSETIPGDIHGSEEELTESASRARVSKFRKPMKAKDPGACRQPFYGDKEVDLDEFFRSTVLLTKKQQKLKQKLNAEILLKIDYNGVIRSASIMSSNKMLIQQVKNALTKMDLWNPAVKNGVTIRTTVRFTIAGDNTGQIGLKGRVIVPRMLADCGKTPNEDLFDFSDRDPGEKILPGIFDVKDKNIVKSVVQSDPPLDSLLLVVDLTGSMGPYIAQVLDLMAELVVSEKPHVSCIALFNDGDGKADRNKVIGNTGGISILKEGFGLEDLAKMVLKSMRKGNGGDVMENNIEALKAGLSKCRSCRDVIMIADNYATPRDAALITEISVPVHWILCGVYDEVNVHYLDLVRQNKGFLHAGNTHLSGLHLLSEGEKVKIEGREYVLRHGKFTAD